MCIRDRATDTRGVPGVQNAQLDADYWIKRQPQANNIVLDRSAIAAQNARLQQTDDSVRDIEALPDRLDAAQVKAWVGDLSQRPSRTLYDVQGREVPAKTLDALVRDVRIGAMHDQAVTRGLRGGHRADAHVPDQRVQRLRRHFAALHVVQRPARTL